MILPIMTMDVWYTLGGLQLYCPPPFPPLRCRNEPEIALTKEPTQDPLVELSEDLLNLSLRIDVFHRGFNYSKVYCTMHQIYPSIYAPQHKPTILYERDLVDEIEPWMPNRVTLLEEAYRIERLLSVCIVPQDPKIRQTWFQSRVTKIIPEDVAPPYFTQIELSSFAPKAIDTGKTCGFIAPFPTFSSVLCAQDPRFDKLESILLGSTLDISSATTSLPDETLRDQLNELLTTFLEDGGAKSIALRFHCQGRAYLKLFHKELNSVE